MTKLYFNGNIITMDAAFSEKERDAVAAAEAVVTKDDIIAFVGSLEAAKSFLRKEALTEGADREDAGNEPEAAQLVDLEGKTLIPGFIDPHSHFTTTAQSIEMCDLSSAVCFDDIIGLLREYIRNKKVTADGIVMGRNYDHNFLEEKRHPDRHVLDEVSKEIPIFILHTSMHMGACNTVMLELSEITRDTKDPQGGRYGREADGTPDGYIEEASAMAGVLMKASPRLKGDMMAQMDKAQQEYFKYGVTTAQDGASSEAALTTMTAFDNTGRMKLDVVAYPMLESYDKCIEMFPEKNKKYQGHIKIGGIKILLDGSPQGKTAWMSKPYEGESEYRGYPTHEDAYVVAAAKKAIENRTQLLAHCNGDAASEQLLDSYEKALHETGAECEGLAGKAANDNVMKAGEAAIDNVTEAGEAAIDSVTEAIKAEADDKSVTASGNLNLRPVMIHCQTVRDDQLGRMAKIKMIPSIFVGHIWYWGDIHIQNLGNDRGSRISPVGSALGRGLIYNFHQDTPVTAPDMLHSVWCAVNRVTRSGREIGSSQKIGVYDALKAVTTNAAYEYHEEDTKGAICSGFKADLVILSGNPLSCEPEMIRDIHVVSTIKNGDCVYSE